MSPNDLLALLKPKTGTFRGLRLYVSDGAQFEVKHPDLAMVSNSTVVLGIPGPRGEQPVERFVHVSLMHITRVEPIEAAVA